VRERLDERAASEDAYVDAIEGNTHDDRTG
jgi:hypothetical protein